MTADCVFEGDALETTLGGKVARSITLARRAGEYGAFE